MSAPKFALYFRVCMQIEPKCIHSVAFHWCLLTSVIEGRVTHIGVVNVTLTVGIDNGLVPVRCQVIIWTNVSGKMWIEIQIFHRRKLIGKCRLQNSSHFAIASMCFVAKYPLQQSILIQTIVVVPFLHLDVHNSTQSIRYYDFIRRT